jgi:hypothetical protein
MRWHDLPAGFSVVRPCRTIFFARLMVLTHVATGHGVGRYGGPCARAFGAIAHRRRPRRSIPSELCAMLRVSNRLAWALTQDKNNS